MAAPENQMLEIAKRFLPEHLTRDVVVPFLDEKSLFAFSCTCKHYRNRYKDKHTDKKTAAKMLDCVLNPTYSNRARFIELLSEPKNDLNGLPLYLIPNHGEEVYFNKTEEKKIKTKRLSTNVLEAVLRTGNFHLVKLLFDSIPRIEKTDALKHLIKNIKAQGIWGMRELQATYSYLLDHWSALSQAENLKELGRRSGLIGLAQKEHVPWFSLYLFFQPGTHANANYELALNWDHVQLWDNAKLDLDLFAANSSYALYKGEGELATACKLRPRCGWDAEAIRLDSASFNRQCVVLSSILDKIINQFQRDELESEMAPKKQRLQTW